jgi:hypothetical protein
MSATNRTPRAPAMSLIVEYTPDTGRAVAALLAVLAWRPQEPSETNRPPRPTLGGLTGMGDEGAMSSCRL